MRSFAGIVRGFNPHYGLSMGLGAVVIECLEAPEVESHRLIALHENWSIDRQNSIKMPLKHCAVVLGQLPEMQKIAKDLIDQAVHVEWKDSASWPTIKAAG